MGGRRVLWMDSMRGQALFVVLESGALLLVGAMRCDVLRGLLIFFVQVWIWVCSLGDF